MYFLLGEGHSLPDYITPLVCGGGIGAKLNLDVIEYPKLPIWDTNMNLYPFSIEFWLYEYPGSDEMDIFVPCDNNGPVMGSGIFYRDGAIIFSVSNGTGTEEPTDSHSIKYQIENRNKSHHFVCRYSISGLDMFCDGGKVASLNLETFRYKWIHHLEKFITAVDSDNTFKIDHVAIYKKLLNEDSIYAHYLAGLNVTGSLELASNSDFIAVQDTGYNLSKDFMQPKDGKWEVYESKGMSESATSYFIKPATRPWIENETDPVFDNALDLQAGQTLICSDIAEKMNALDGGIGGQFYLSGDKNNSNRYCLFSLTLEESSISVIKDEDNKISILHIHPNGEELIPVGDAVFDSWNHVILTWSAGLYSLYLEDDDTVIQYTPVTNFNILQVTTVNVGGLGREFLLEDKVKYFNIYKEIPNLPYMSTIKEDIGTYTLRLQDDLEVSRYGYVKFRIDAEALGEIAEARVNYGPVQSEITVTQSLDDVAYIDPQPDESPVANFTFHKNLTEDMPEIYYKIEFLSHESEEEMMLNFFRVKFFEQTVIRGNNTGICIESVGDFTTGAQTLPIISNYRSNGITYREGYGLIYGAKEQDFYIDELRVEAAPPKNIKSLEMWVKIVGGLTGRKTILYYNKNIEIELYIEDGDIEVSGLDEFILNGEEYTTFDASLIQDEWVQIVLNIPEGEYRTNLITDPRATDTSNFNGISSTLGLSSEPDEIFDTAIEATKTGGEYGLSYQVSVIEGETYTFSTYLKVNIGDEEEGVAKLKVGSEEVSKSIYDDWSRFSLTFTAEATGNLNLSALTTSGTKLYSTNWMLEKGEILYPYFDGSIDDNEWAGTEDDSESIDYLGIIIDDDDFVFLNTPDGQNPNTGISITFSNFTFRNFVISEAAAEELYRYNFDRKVVQVGLPIIDAENGDNILPIVLSEFDQDYSTGSITDQEPLAVTGSWNIQTGTS